MSFTTIFFQLIDEVTHPVHLHSLHTFSCKVHHKLSDLCGADLPYKLANYDLERKVHCAILYRGYLVTYLSFFDFVISFLDALFQGEV
jgi:hypothetical protein